MIQRTFVGLMGVFCDLRLNILTRREWNRMVQQLRIQEVLVTELSTHKELIMNQLHELQDVVLDMANR